MTTVESLQQEIERLQSMLPPMIRSCSDTHLLNGIARALGVHLSLQDIIHRSSSSTATLSTKNTSSKNIKNQSHKKLKNQNGQQLQQQMISVHDDTTFHDNNDDNDNDNDDDSSSMMMMIDSRNNHDSDNDGENDDENFLFHNNVNNNKRNNMMMENDIFGNIPTSTVSSDHMNEDYHGMSDAFGSSYHTSCCSIKLESSDESSEHVMNDNDGDDGHTIKTEQKTTKKMNKKHNGVILKEEK